jgi:hypothetical protein
LQRTAVIGQRIFAVVLAASAVYGMASTLLFALVFGPFAGPEHLTGALSSACFVALPYALMYLVYRITADQVSQLVLTGSAFVIVIIGGVVYSGGFGSNDGEFSLMFVITPVMQLPFVLLAFVVSMWRKRVRAAEPLVREPGDR